MEVVPVSGSVSTARVATLSAEVEGRVSGLPVEEGQRIEKGALLMTLDDELVQRDLDRDRAEVARLGSTLDDAQRRLSEARYQHAFFRWAHPRLAAYCERYGVPYPALDDEGRIAEPRRFDFLLSEAVRRGEDA